MLPLPRRKPYKKLFHDGGQTVIALIFRSRPILTQLPETDLDSRRFQFYGFHGVTDLTPVASKNLPRHCSLEWSVRRSRDCYAIDRLAQRSRSFSALGDQRAEILPVQRPPTLVVGVRCMMRLTRILIFPFYPLSIMDQRPLNEAPSKMLRGNKCYSLRDRPFLAELP